MLGAGIVVAAYIKSLTLRTKIVLSFAPSKLLFVHFKTTSFFLQLKQGRFLLPLLVINAVMFISKESY